MPKEDGQWKKGQSGNKRGRPRLPETVKKAREINQIEFERVMNKLLYLTPDQVKRRLKNKSLPVVEQLLGQIIHKAAMEGDTKRAEWIMTRMLGKPVDRLEVTAQRESRNLNVSVAVSQSQAQVAPPPEIVEVLSPHATMAQLQAMQDEIDKLRVASLPPAVEQGEAIDVTVERAVPSETEDEE